MSHFYLAIHSDASLKSLPNNRSANFKTILAREIDLGNTEYKVAIASVSRYYETSLDDVVFLLEKRQSANATPVTTETSLDDAVFLLEKRQSATATPGPRYKPLIQQETHQRFYKIIMHI